MEQGFIMHELKQTRELTDLLSVSLSMLQERIGIVIGGTLFFSLVPALPLVPGVIAVLMSGAVTSESGPPDMTKLLPSLGTLGICAIFSTLCYYALRVGWVSICLKISKGEAAPFSEFFACLPKFGTFLVLNILLGLVILAGSMLFVIPGIYCGIRLAFAPYILVEKNLGPIDAMKESWSMVEGMAMKVFLAGLAFFVINMIVGFVPLLGIIAQFIVIAYYDLLIVSLYRDRKGDLVVPG